MTCLTQSPYDFILAKLTTKTVQYFGGHIKEIKPDIYNINCLKKRPHVGDLFFQTLKTRQ